MSRRGSRWLGALPLVVVAALQPARAEDWTWPEKPQNLQVLPADWSGSRLRPVMTGFTRALGVRCSHCHVGEEGAPLSTYDFASDADPDKDRAREMLRMLESINGHLRKIEPSGDRRVNMWCHTCHHGRPRPMTLAEELAEAHRLGGVDAALERYRNLEQRYHGLGAYRFDEETLNGFGYELLEAGDVEGAVAAFELNASEYPGSANAWDSLAEGQLTAGRAGLAAKYYRKSLRLDPENTNAASRLDEIRRLKAGSRSRR